MARDITTFRTVGIQSTPQQADVLDVGIDIGKDIIRQSQEAKITENFSNAQLDINQLDMQYQTEFEGKPFDEEGLKNYKQQRQDILSGYGDQISPLFRGKWNSSARGIEKKNDATMQAWGYKQARVNTVGSINTSIQNNMSQASIDGQNFGNQDTDEIGSMLNFAESKQNLVEFGDKNLGEETTTKLLNDYDEDYLKSFIGGVAETDTLKALRLMEKDEVKNSFSDQAQYLKMKDAIETRSLNIGKINSQQEVLDVLRDENSLLAKSIEQPVSYPELQKEFDKNKMSASAQSFFLKANGFKERGTKLSASKQLSNKAQLYSDMTKLMSKENVTTAEVSKFQERIYKGMDNGSLNEKEGVGYLNELVAPLVEQKEKNFSKFSQDSWISPDVGFGGVQEMFDDNIAIQPAEGEDEVGEVSKALNSSNKVKFYDYYMSSLDQAAKASGVNRIGDIQNLNKTQQRDLYSQAQNEAFRLFSIDQNPALSTLNDIPNQTFSNGKLIQGAAGDRAIKPDAIANPTFKTFKAPNGLLFRLHPNGRYEQVGKAK